MDRGKISTPAFFSVEPNITDLSLTGQWISTTGQDFQEGGQPPALTDNSAVPDLLTYQAEEKHIAQVISPTRHMCKQI